MAAPYKAVAIANCFLEIADKHGGTISPMNIQRLVYFAHGWHLALTAEPLIDEQIEATCYGLVISSLCRELKEYGNGPIMYSIGVDIHRKEDVSSFSFPMVPQEDTYTHALLNRIWKIYGKFTAIQSCNLANKEGSPWDETVKEYGGRNNVPQGTDINRNKIEKFFKNKLTEGEQRMETKKDPPTKPVRPPVRYMGEADDVVRVKDSELPDNIKLTEGYTTIDIRGSIANLLAFFDTRKPSGLHAMPQEAWEELIWIFQRPSLGKETKRILLMGWMDLLLEKEKPCIS